MKKQSQVERMAATIRRRDATVRQLRKDNKKMWNQVEEQQNSEFRLRTQVDDARQTVEELASKVSALEQPIPMILHCPVCHTQHIDAPNPDQKWYNPPHRSHQCQDCGTIWRPADVATVGVRDTASKGSNDTWVPGMTPLYRQRIDRYTQEFPRG